MAATGDVVCYGNSHLHHSIVPSVCNAHIST